MFKRILITESLDSIRLGLRTALQNDLDTKICVSEGADTALLKIKKSLDDNFVYDLIITSLSYDNENINIKNGELFIDMARNLLPGVKIMVYSDDMRDKRIHELFHTHKINAFVAHGPESMPEIIDGVKMLYRSEVIFMSPRCLPPIKNQSEFDLDEFDVSLLQHLSLGKTQTEISKIFIDKGNKHASVSTIKKKINKLRLLLEANNTINLIAIAKDLNII